MDYGRCSNWRDLGISQAIYHRSRDAELSGATE